MACVDAGKWGHGVYLYAWVGVHVCIFEYVRVFVCFQGCTCMYLCVHMSMYGRYEHMYACVCVCLYIYIYIYIYTYMRWQV